jgi:hypothetical protein
MMQLLQSLPKEETPKPEPKKRGRKSKNVYKQWLKKQAEKEVNLPLYSRKMEAQLDVSLEVHRVIRSIE